MEENLMLEEEVISIGEVLESLKKRWKLIFICTLTVTILVTVVTLFFIKPKYETSTKLFVGKEQGAEQVYNSSDVQMYQQLLKTYSEVIKTRDVASAAINSQDLDLKAKDMLNNLSVVTLADTQILEIKYQSTKPEEALKVIQGVKEVFMEKAVELVPNGNIHVLEKPTFPEKPVSPNKKMNIAIGLFLGMMVGIGLAFLLEFLDNSFKSKEQLERAVDVPVLGTIPFISSDN
ncbi:MAG: Wzz/FepE/Etk N-terminal domain-containing protein [Clostridium sp.]|nr:Wzz/FepE/Etk N-terminal domain-containing protein [Clostridium sp.]MDU7084323.1 Wzz/FepE/Etk N-terminal domain-containing protein [Clostridium sp.]